MPALESLKSHARLAGEATLVAIIAALWWSNSKPQPAPVGVAIEAAPSKELSAVFQQTVQPKAGVKVYAPEAKKKLDLPPSVQSNPSVLVTTSADLKETDRPQTVATTIDLDTGVSTIYVKQDPYPWLAAESSKAISLSYGLKGYSASRGGSSTLVWRATFRDDLVQVKALHLGAQASVDSDASYYVGIGITYKF